MNRKSLGIKILATVAVLAATLASALVPVADAFAVDYSPYVLTDFDEKKLTYGSVTGCPWVDGDVDGVYDKNEFAATNDVGRYSIIGFNMEDADPIVDLDSLTIKVSYYTYKWFLFDWLYGGKEAHEETFTWTDANRFRVAEGLRMEALVNPNSFNLYSVPLYGQVADLIMLMGEDAMIFGSFWVSNFGFNRASDPILRESPIADCDWYVVIPVYHTYYQTWISMSGPRESGEYVTDGTDAGVPFHDYMGNYIEFEQGITPRSATFTSSGLVTFIKVLDFSAGVLPGQVFIEFGDYNYDDDIWIEYDHLYVRDANVTTAVYLNIPYDHQVIVTFSNDAYGKVRVYYESDTNVVYNNILGSDGKERPGTKASSDGGSQFPWISLIIILASVAVGVYFLGQYIGKPRIQVLNTSSSGSSNPGYKRGRTRFHKRRRSKR